MQPCSNSDTWDYIVESGYCRYKNESFTALTAVKQRLKKYNLSLEANAHDFKEIVSWS